MADENKKPWYMDTHYLSLIIAIVAIVVPMIIWLLSRSSDFSVSIDPMLGAIQAGGVIQTTVSVKGIGGYDHTVSLSATGQPSGVVIAFVPPFGVAKPSYASSVTINVDKNVPVDDYTLVFKGTGADGKEHSCSYTLTVKPPVTSTPTPTITPTSASTPTETPPPNATNVIDSMESTLYWKIYKCTGSSINIKSVPGRTDNGIEIFYDLEERGWVLISKEINPEILSEYKGLRFYYKGSGEPNTIELKLIYEDTTTFGVVWNSATITDNWITLEVPYSHFDCWWPYNNCLRYGNKLNLEKVRKIEFAISNKPEDGDLYGSGKMIIDDVQGIIS